MNKKYIVRRNLDIYSENIFAKKLIKKGQQPFFPFKDMGVDIIGIDKNNKPFFYQLKARNINLRFGEFWFQVKEKDLDKFPDIENSFWVFCCFKDNGEFDFFITPFKIVKTWYAIEKSERTSKKGAFFLSIKPKDGAYELAPKRLNKEIDIMKYYMKE